jgi:hypothetical protein
MVLFAAGALKFGDIVPSLPSPTSPIFWLIRRVRHDFSGKTGGKLEVVVALTFVVP